MQNRSQNGRKASRRAAGGLWGTKGGLGFLTYEKGWGEGAQHATLVVVTIKEHVKLRTAYTQSVNNAGSRIINHFEVIVNWNHWNIPQNKDLATADTSKKAKIAISWD